jgi:DNA-binding NarL/FixJ family response regulator
MAMNRERIIVADDHPLFRESLCRLVAGHLPDAEISEAGSAAEVLDLVEREGAPDLFLLDLLFPGMTPRETLSLLRQRCPKSSIVIVSMLDDEATIERMMELGADGYIVKAISGSEMVEAIMAVRAGRFVIARPGQSAAGDVIPAITDIMDLTARQREILAGVIAGKSTKQIGRELDLSPFTVRNHLTQLFRAFKAGTRAELASKAQVVSPN